MSRKARRKRKQQRRSSGQASRGTSLAPRPRTAAKRVSSPPRFGGDTDPSFGTPTGSVLAMRREQSFSGPLPHPDILEAYDRALAGTAERIVAAWETESGHRRRIENEAVAMDVTLVANEVWLSRAGMIIGALIALAFLAAAVYLAVNGQPVVGGVIAGVDVVALVTVFVVRARARAHRAPASPDGGRRPEQLELPLPTPDRRP